MPPLLLLLHSTGTTPSMWANLPEEVSRGRSLLAPAHLGYPPNRPVPRGESCGASEDTAYIHSLVAKFDAIDIVAHSYGGLVAAKLLPLLGARVRTMCLFEPVLFGALAKSVSAATDEATRALLEHPWFLHDAARGGGEEWLEMFIDYWNRPGSWKRLPEPAREEMRRTGWKMFQEVRSCFFDETRFEDVAFAGPLTLVASSRSPEAARSMVKEFARVNPHAKTEVLEGVGHMAPLTHPALVHEALIRHLRSQDP